MTANASMDAVPGIWTLKIINPIPKIMEMAFPLARRIEENMNSNNDIAMAMRELLTGPVKEFLEALSFSFLSGIS